MSDGKTLTLSNGVKIPAVGFGTFSSEGSKGEAYAAVLHALRTGYRHLDCAWFYLNEDEIGDAIRDFLKENPSVKRSDLFITTKVWNNLHEHDEVKWSLENSLKMLQLDYVDLFLIHWPIACESTEDKMPKIGPDGKVSTRRAPLFPSPLFCFSSPTAPGSPGSLRLSPARGSPKPPAWRGTLAYHRRGRRGRG